MLNLKTDFETAGSCPIRRRKDSVLRWIVQQGMTASTMIIIAETEASLLQNNRFCGVLWCLWKSLGGLEVVHIAHAITTTIWCTE